MKSSARRARDSEKLAEKWHARREAEQRAAAPEPSNEPIVPEPSSHNAYTGAAIDATREAALQKLREAVQAEQIRVANSTRVGISVVIDECLAVHEEADAEARRGSPVSREDLLRRKLERLGAFESEVLMATAPESHMATEWGPQVQG